MWIEIDVMLSGSTMDWQELGLDVKHEFVRRMVRVNDVAYVQELVHDIQVIYFYDQTSCLIRGTYAEIRDELIHLSQEDDLDL
jgi:hypothetical protein